MTGDPSFPIVGIGASAGGLAAFEAFFSGMPESTNPGMAFVLVQHLAPDHHSMLTELIQRTTRMKVQEVTDGMAVQINCVYVIPPNRDMAFVNGCLHLLEPTVARGLRLPLDYLFRSLAQDQKERAIGIVLSGTGSDGTLGVRAIKGEGGMVMAQTPDSCEFNGMPKSAIETGLVDYIRPPSEMHEQLIAYTAQAFGKGTVRIGAALAYAENTLKKILFLLRSQTGHDFSQYKPGTIYRRIERRMAVHQIESLDGYTKYLQQTPIEVDSLFRDLLISVTQFFRDPEAFEALEKQVIPKLFEDKPAGTTVRVWVAGCATGEEAYSLAILLQEQMEACKQNYKVQIFATDIDTRAIAVARAGVYPASIAEDVSASRLARFFSAEANSNGYLVNKVIRDMLVFSNQDLIKDPPFSRLDLISCRNLLIYLGPDLQKGVMSVFHYALNNGGMLFLGTSETVGELGDLFLTLDRKSKLYLRKVDIQGAQRAALDRFLPATTGLRGTSIRAIGKTVLPVKLSLRELTEQALAQELDIVAALVNGRGDILYLHGRAGRYLEPTQGEASINNILKMARDGLRRHLTTCLHKVENTKERVSATDLRIKTNGSYSLANLTVCPVINGPAAGLEFPLYLVLLEEPTPLALTAPAPAVAQSTDSEANDINAQVTKLHAELEIKEAYLHAANAELETSNEELKSSNEEMQSINEELQSSNEELETAKEELQSINEELSTVNTELQSKVTDLSRANNDMNNLLAGTGIGTIFVDHDLRILRFTPAATQIINLILSDMGRPVGHIVSNLVGYNSLLDDIQTVLGTLVPKAVDVQTVTGKFFTMRILPYRTLDNVIEGAVLTFADISEIVQTREALRKTNELLRLAVVVRDAHDAITVQDLEGRIIAWNPGATRLYGWTEAQALKMNVRERIPTALQHDALTTVRKLSQTKALEPYLTQRLTKDGVPLEVSLTSTALINTSGQMYAIATTERELGQPVAQNLEHSHDHPV